MREEKNMGKTLKKVLTIVVTFTMVFSSLIVLKPVNAEDETKTYTIFPTPQRLKTSLSYSLAYLK